MRFRKAIEKIKSAGKPKNETFLEAIERIKNAGLKNN